MNYQRGPARTPPCTIDTNAALLSFRGLCLLLNLKDGGLRIIVVPKSEVKRGWSRDRERGPMRRGIRCSCFVNTQRSEACAHIQGGNKHGSASPFICTRIRTRRQNQKKGNVNTYFAVGGAIFCPLSRKGNQQQVHACMVVHPCSCQCARKDLYICLAFTSFIL